VGWILVERCVIIPGVMVGAIFNLLDFPPFSATSGSEFPELAMMEEHGLLCGFKIQREEI
jgi:hypothetical protein